MSIAARIILVMIFHVIILGSMVSQHIVTLRTGVPIKVLTKPVDPEDLYTGNRMDFDYAIGEIDLADIDGSDDFRRFDPAFVVLQDIDGIWYARRIENTVPDLDDGEIFIRGRVTQIRPGRRRLRGDDGPPFIRVSYGIEDYTVSPTVADYFRRRLSNVRLVNQILIDRTGRALLVGIVGNDGYPLDEPRLF